MRHLVTMVVEKTANIEYYQKDWRKQMKKYKIILTVLLMFFCVSGISSEKTAYGASKISLNKTSLKITVGSSKQLRVNGTTKNVKWSSSDKSIATVSKTGKVKAKKKGSTSIVAKVGSKKLKCKVIVSKLKKESYITNKNFQGTFMLNGEGSFEKGWYSVIIYEITSDNKVRFQLNAGTRNGSRMAVSNVIEASIKDNKVDFMYKDTVYESAGKGTIIFNSNISINLNVNQTYVPSFCKLGLEIEDSTFYKTSDEHKVY